MLHSYVTDMAARVMPTIQIPTYLHYTFIYYTADSGACDCVLLAILFETRLFASYLVRGKFPTLLFQS